MDNEDCCCCASMCTSCCPEEELQSQQKKSKEEELKEHQRFQLYMRLLVYAGYAFAVIGALTQPHIGWSYPTLHMIFWFLLLSSFGLYEVLRVSDPGFVPREKVYLPRKPAYSSASSSTPTPAPGSRSAGSSGNGTMKSRNGYNHVEDSPVAEARESVSLLLEDPSTEFVVRYKFCKKCDNYVAKYDHHCVWIGTCVGEKNHFLFVWFLLMVCAFIVYSFFVSCSAIYYVHTDMELLKQWKKLVFSIIIVWSAMIVCIVAFFMPFCLLVHHLYLVATNQTSYEVYRAEKLEYLKSLPESAAKFDEGCLINCKRFCTEQNPLFNRKKRHEFIQWTVSSEEAKSMCRSCDDCGDCDKTCERMLECDCCMKFCCCCCDEMTEEVKEN